MSFLETFKLCQKNNITNLLRLLSSLYFNIKLIEIGHYLGEKVMHVENRKDSKYNPGRSFRQLQKYRDYKVG